MLSLLYLKGLMCNGLFCFEIPDIFDILEIFSSMFQFQKTMETTHAWYLFITRLWPLNKMSQFTVSH